MKNNFTQLVAASLIAAFALGTVGGAQEAPTTATNAVLSVALISPKREMWPDQLETNGRLQPWQEAIVSAEVSGHRIDSVLFDVGDKVKKGDILVELSRATLESIVLQQQANVLSAEASYEQAKADANRARSLASGRSGALSAQQASEYYVTERKAEAQLASAKAVLASAELDLQNAQILAPDDGVISSRSAALGAVVNSGTELFRLIRQSRIEWQAEVPLRFLRQIEPGTKVVIPGPGDVPEGRGVVEGEVRLISPTASEKTGRVVVYVALIPPEGAPMPKTGMMVSGLFELGDREALALPTTAVTLRDGYSYVFAIEEGSEPAKVTRQRVETGRRNGDQVEIISGLEGNERIVVAGGAFLSEGSVVAIVEPQQ